MKSVKTNADIKEYCKILRLNGIGQHFEEVAQESTDYEDFLCRLLSYELDEAEERMKQSRIRAARFPYKKYLEDLELDCLPEGLRKRLPELATLDFTRNGQNLILTGNPGTGKTHTAIGLGIKACEQGFRVLFTTVPYLVTELKECVNAKTLKAFERKFEKYDLVIADEMGYVSFDREGADLQQLIHMLQLLTQAFIFDSEILDALLQRSQFCFIDCYLIFAHFLTVFSASYDTTKR